MEMKINEIEVTKLNLEPGQVLAVKVYHDDVSQMDLTQLKTQIQSFFPNNRIMLFAMPVDGRIEMDVLDTRPQNPLVVPPGVPNVNLTSPCAEPAAYCGDCGCGKKERIEGMKK